MEVTRTHVGGVVCISSLVACGSLINQNPTAALASATLASYSAAYGFSETSSFFESSHIGLLVSLGLGVGCNLALLAVSIHSLCSRFSILNQRS